MSSLVLLIVCLLSLISFVISEQSDNLLDEYVKYVEKNNVHFPGSKTRTEISRKQDQQVIRHKRDIGFNRVIENDSDSDDEDLWTHTEVLSAKFNYIVKWYRTENAKEIVFRVEADTMGYIGFGFSPNGNMKNADIVIAWFDNEMGQPALWVSFFYINFC